ncbi:MAG: response regulator, partial [Gammaproteobacteria bacterium]
MNEPDILLINLNQSTSESDVRRLLDGHLRFTCLRDADAIPEFLQSGAPVAICFEYDYPDIPRLAALQETKLAYPSLPIVMVTTQHSEDLAVWAFRSRVWDYFVKPLPVADVLECFRAIQALPAKQQHAPRKFMLRECTLPADTRFQASARSREARAIRAAITYVERNLHSKISQAEIARTCGMSSSQ